MVTIVRSWRAMARLAALLFFACAAMLSLSVTAQSVCTTQRLKSCAASRGRRPLMTRSEAARLNFQNELRTTFQMRMGELATMVDEGGAGDPTLLYNVQIYTSPLIRYGERR